MTSRPSVKPIILLNEKSQSQNAEPSFLKSSLTTSYWAPDVKTFRKESSQKKKQHPHKPTQIFSSNSKKKLSEFLLCFGITYVLRTNINNLPKHHRTPFQRHQKNHYFSHSIRWQRSLKSGIVRTPLLQSHLPVLYIQCRFFILIIQDQNFLQELMPDILLYLHGRRARHDTGLTLLHVFTVWACDWWLSNSWLGNGGWYYSISWRWWALKNGPIAFVSFFSFFLKIWWLFIASLRMSVCSFHLSSVFGVGVEVEVRCFRVSWVENNEISNDEKGLHHGQNKINY